MAVVGRSPQPDAPTLNQGILSAVSRLRGTAVQTDAELNYGNVGGPLVDLDGRLIGVTSHIVPQAVWGQSGGVGFATPMAELDKVLDRLKGGERIEKVKEPWIGITPGEGSGGVPIDQVLPGSPAEQAELMDGDVIFEFEGKPVATADELNTLVMEHKVGDTVKLKIRRTDEKGKAEEIEVNVTLGDNPY